MGAAARGEAVTRPAHEHDLDGKLHDACPMCDEIRSRYARARVEQANEAALGRHQAVAERSRIGRDALAREEAP